MNEIRSGSRQGFSGFLFFNQAQGNHSPCCVLHVNLFSKATLLPNLWPDSVDHHITCGVVKSENYKLGEKFISSEKKSERFV